MQLTRWLIFSLASSLLVLAACGDDGDSNGNGAPSAPTATAVISDTPVDDSTDGDSNGNGASPFELLAPLAGEWSGVWNSDTSGSSAPITMSIVVNDDGTASFTLDLPDTAEGAPFGVPALGSRTFEGTYDDTGLSIIVRGDDLFGDMNVSISLEGDLIAEATMAGVPGISALIVRGSLDDTSMDIAYNIGLPDNSVATGRATLTKS